MEQLEFVFSDPVQSLLRSFAERHNLKIFHFSPNIPYTPCTRIGIVRLNFQRALETHRDLLRDIEKELGCKATFYRESINFVYERSSYSLDVESSGIDSWRGKRFHVLIGEKDMDDKDLRSYAFFS